MTLFAIVIEDRHADVEVEVWADEQQAITRARQIARDYCRHPEDYEEQDIKGWSFYARYSCESDSVSVRSVPLNE